MALYEFCVGLPAFARCHRGSLVSAWSRPTPTASLTEPVLHGDLIGYILSQGGSPWSSELRAWSSRAWHRRAPQPGPGSHTQGSLSALPCRGPTGARRSGGMDAPLRNPRPSQRRRGAYSSQAHPGPTGLTPGLIRAPSRGSAQGPHHRGSPQPPTMDSPQASSGPTSLCRPWPAPQGLRTAPGPALLVGWEAGTPTLCPRG